MSGRIGSSVVEHKANENAPGEFQDPFLLPPIGDERQRGARPRGTAPNAAYPEIASRTLVLLNINDLRAKLLN